MRKLTIAAIIFNIVLFAVLMLHFLGKLVTIKYLFESDLNCYNEYQISTLYQHVYFDAVATAVLCITNLCCFVYFFRKIKKA
jgi:hypothetical protein